MCVKSPSDVVVEFSRWIPSLSFNTTIEKNIGVGFERDESEFSL